MTGVHENLQHVGIMFEEENLFFRGGEICFRRKPVSFEIRYKRRVLTPAFTKQMPDILILKPRTSDK